MVKITVMACVMLHNILRNRVGQNVGSDQQGNQTGAMLHNNDDPDEGHANRGSEAA